MAYKMNAVETPMEVAQTPPANLQVASGYMSNSSIKERMNTLLDQGTDKSVVNRFLKSRGVSQDDIDLFTNERWREKEQEHDIERAKTVRSK